jgi:hypothetical protein
VGAPPFRGLGGRPPAGALARSLAARCEDVLPGILADCRFDPAEARGHGQDGALWVVALRGAKRGVALCTSEPDRSGDMLALVAEALCGGDTRAAYAWALERCHGVVAPPAASVERRVADDAAEAETRRRRALAKYLSARASIAGTPAANYLAGRGLTDAVTLAALRFAPDCYYGGRAPAIEAYPALVAPVIEPTTRRFLAAHCTYLARRAGGWGKVAREPARKAWGGYRGGIIPLRRGASGKPLRDAPEEELLIGEGIETVLSAAVMRPELRAAAAIACGNFADIALPAQFVGVVLVQDRDGEHPGVKRACERAVDRWLHEGRAVTVLKPPPGHSDFNAWLQALNTETADEKRAWR